MPQVHPQDKRDNNEEVWELHSIIENVETALHLTKQYLMHAGNGN